MTQKQIKKYALFLVVFIFLTIVDMVLYGARTFLGYTIINMFEILIFFLGFYVARKSKNKSISDTLYSYITSNIFIFFGVFLLFLIAIKILWTQGVWYGLK